MEGRRVAIGAVLLTAAATTWISAVLVAAPNHHRHSYVVWLIVAGAVCFVSGLVTFEAHRLLHRKEPTPEEFGRELARGIAYMQEALRVTTREMGAMPPPKKDVPDLHLPPVQRRDAR